MINDLTNYQIKDTVKDVVREEDPLPPPGTELWVETATGDQMMTADGKRYVFQQ